MSQYRELVEAKRHEQMVEAKAKKWSKGIKYLLAENGYIETKFNSGLIERTYHRDKDGHREKDTVTVQQGNSIKTIIDDFSRALADRSMDINEW